VAAKKKEEELGEWGDFQGWMSARVRTDDVMN
jgi:hypothetical protein